MKAPKYNLKIEKVSGPGGYYYIVNDEEDPERGTLFGPHRNDALSTAFRMGFDAAVGWLEEVGMEEE